MNCPKFEDAIRAHGMEPPYDMEPGKAHRFAGIGKRLNNRAGWCILFEDGEGGCFGDWSTGLSESWQSGKVKKFTERERAEFNERVSKASRNAAEDRDAQWAKAAQTAERVYVLCREAPADFPYLVDKQIKPHNARLDGNRLVLPIMDFNRKITCLQYIAENGEKRMLTGGRKKGCFIPLSGCVTEPSSVIICEGWATGATLTEEHTSALVLAAIDAGNISSVATGAALKWPDAELVVAGDDDRSKQDNVGARMAREAAKRSGAKLALPQWPEGAPVHLSDFNDLANYLKQKVA